MEIYTCLLSIIFAVIFSLNNVNTLTSPSASKMIMRIKPDGEKWKIVDYECSKSGKCHRKCSAPDQECTYDCYCTDIDDEPKEGTGCINGSNPISGGKDCTSGQEEGDSIDASVEFESVGLAFGIGPSCQIKMRNNCREVKFRGKVKFICQRIPVRECISVLWR